MSPMLSRAAATIGLRFLLIGTILTADAHAAHADYALEIAYPNLDFSFPTDIQPANDGTDRLFVVEKRGYIWVFPDEDDVVGDDASLFLDVSSKVRTSGEAGLLGLAFDPDYKLNGDFFVFYISTAPSRTVVARYNVSADPNLADPASEVILIDVPQPTVFHNGGQLAFGNDGYLYIAMGDNRVMATAQDLTDLPGSILRVSVDVDPVPLAFGLPPYEIPPDNPFANNESGYRPEIYAYGFRNPWRFSLDEYTGEFWVCDVGENEYEEIDLVKPGRNYGWPLMEGPECYQPEECDTNGANLDLPLYSYTHNEGLAIVGGFRYWGTRLRELTGMFIFADYASGFVWALHYDGAGTPERFTLIDDAPLMLTVGKNGDGEFLMGSGDGFLYRLGHILTGAGDGLPGTRLIGNFPNPFNPSTTIRFVLERAAEVRIDIVSVTGARVRRFESAPREAGEHSVVWRGEDDRGGRVASGVYFCRLVVDGVQAGSTRMVLVQ